MVYSKASTFRLSRLTTMNLSGTRTASRPCIYVVTTLSSCVLKRKRIRIYDPKRVHIKNIRAILEIEQKDYAQDKHAKVSFRGNS